jgi:cytochrome c oxidase subunit 1
MMGKGVKASSNPWEDKNSDNLVKGAEGLEWEVASPAPFHTFETPPKLNAAATKIIA